MFIETIAAFVIAVLLFMLAWKIFIKLVGFCWMVIGFALRIVFWPVTAIINLLFGSML